MNFLLTLLITLIMLSCTDLPTGMTWYQLQNGQLKIEIPAPDGVSEHYKSYPGMEDYMLRSLNGFDLQFYAFELKDLKIEEELEKQLKIVRMEDSFDTIVYSVADGFIFKRRFLETEEEFDFRLIRILGGKEVIFQSGQTIVHTREQVEAMFRAASLAR